MDFAAYPAYRRGLYPASIPHRADGVGTASPGTPVARPITAGQDPWVPALMPALITRILVSQGRALLSPWDLAGPRVTRPADTGARLAGYTW